MWRVRRVVRHVTSVGARIAPHWADALVVYRICGRSIPWRHFCHVCAGLSRALCASTAADR